MITKENIVLGEGGEILSVDITTIKKNNGRAILSDLFRR